MPRRSSPSSLVLVRCCSFDAPHLSNNKNQNNVHYYRENSHIWFCMFAVEGDPGSSCWICMYINNVPSRSSVRLSLLPLQVYGDYFVPYIYVTVCNLISLALRFRGPIYQLVHTHTSLGAPHVCPAFISFPVVIAYVSVHSSLVIEMQVYLVLSGLSNTGWAPRV